MVVMGRVKGKWFAATRRVPGLVGRAEPNSEEPIESLKW